MTFVSIQNKLAVLLLAAMLFGAGYWAYNIWKGAEESAVLSCLYSISEAVNKASKSGKLEITDQPRKLAPAEIEQILSGYKDLDCRQKDDLSQAHIAVGNKINEHTNVNIKVWMNGDDAVAGTDDDLVVPWGEKVTVK